MSNIELQLKYFTVPCKVYVLEDYLGTCYGSEYIYSSRICDAVVGRATPLFDVIIEAGFPSTATGNPCVPYDDVIPPKRG